MKQPSIQQQLIGIQLESAIKSAGIVVDPQELSILLSNSIPTKNLFEMVELNYPIVLIAKKYNEIKEMEGYKPLNFRQDQLNYITGRISTIYPATILRSSPSNAINIINQALTSTGDYHSQFWKDSSSQIIEEKEEDTDEEDEVNKVEEDKNVDREDEKSGNTREEENKVEWNYKGYCLLCIFNRKKEDVREINRSYFLLHIQKKHNIFVPIILQYSNKCISDYKITLNHVVKHKVSLNSVRDITGSAVNRVTFLRNIKRLRNLFINSISTYLRDKEFYYVLSFDGWSAGINQSIKINLFVLTGIITGIRIPIGNYVVEEKHTAEMMAEKIVDIIKNISEEYLEKTIGVVSDNSPHSSKTRELISAKIDFLKRTKGILNPTFNYPDRPHLISTSAKHVERFGLDDLAIERTDKAFSVMFLKNALIQCSDLKAIPQTRFVYAWLSIKEMLKKGNPDSIRGFGKVQFQNLKPPSSDISKLNKQNTEAIKLMKECLINFRPYITPSLVCFLQPYEPPLLFFNNQPLDSVFHRDKMDQIDYVRNLESLDDLPISFPDDNIYNRFLHRTYLTSSQSPSPSKRRKTNNNTG
jgi:hypothetical protein